MHIFVSIENSLFKTVCAFFYKLSAQHLRINQPFSWSWTFIDLKDQTLPCRNAAMAWAGFLQGQCEAACPGHFPGHIAVEGAAAWFSWFAGAVD
jgi:hypothetical protein